MSREITPPEMSTLWAVTSGEYSDFGVNAIFETEAEARAAIGWLGDDVQELDYYRAGDKPERREIWTARSGRIDANGAMYPSAQATVNHPWTPPRRPSDRPRVTVEREGTFTWVTVEAPTKELAEKTLYDRIAKVRAELLEPGAESG